MPRNLPAAEDLSDSEGNLRTRRECVERGAGIPDVRRADLLGNVAVQVIKHETNVAADVPVQTRAVDCLLSAGYTICSPELIVQIYGADTAGNLPGPSTAAPQRERICRGDAAIGGVRPNIGMRFASRHKAGFGVPPWKSRFGNPGRLLRATLHGK